MAFNVKKRGKLTYYYEGDEPVLSNMVFQCWELWLQEAGICNSIADVDFIEMHAFGCQPKSPHPALDPMGYKEELERLHEFYATALYQTSLRENEN